MDIIAATALMLVSVCAVIYTHYRLGFHVENNRQLWIVRAALIVIGVGFSWVTNQSYAFTGALQVIVAITAFSITHVPSACILFLKRKQREQR